MSGSLGWGSLYRQSIDLSLISGHECGKHLCLSETFQPRVNFYGCREAEHDRCRSSNGSDIDRRLSRLFCQSDRIVDLDRIAMPRSEAVCAYKEWNENGIKGLFLVFFFLIVSEVGNTCVACCHSKKGVLYLFGPAG